MADADLVVVGGGPAGAATAIAAASRGARVVMLEPSSPTVRPGETLHPGVEPILEALGIADRVRAHGFIRHRGIWVTWSGERQFVPYGGAASEPWLGYQAWRRDFDRLLIARALELGVSLRSARAVQPLLNAGRIVGVRTTAGDIIANFSVDATGRAAWLSRHLGLVWRRWSASLIARFGYVRGVCKECEDAPCLESSGDGWEWMARVRRDLYAWVRLRFGAGAGDAAPPRALAGLPPIGRSGGADVTWRSSAAWAGPGFFLVGDAAAVLDPASSHGVLRALMSGIAAGTLIAEVSARRTDEPTAQAAYRSWMRTWFGRDVTSLTALYDRETTAHRSRARGDPGRASVIPAGLT